MDTGTEGRPRGGIGKQSLQGEEEKVSEEITLKTT